MKKTLFLYLGGNKMLTSLKRAPVAALKTQFEPAKLRAHAQQKEATHEKKGDPMPQLKPDSCKYCFYWSTKETSQKIIYGSKYTHKNV